MTRLCANCARVVLVCWAVCHFALTLWGAAPSLNQFLVQEPEQKDSQTRLVYQIEVDDQSVALSKEKMDQLLKGVTRRLRAGQFKGTAKALDQNRLEVVVSTSDKNSLERLKSLLAKPGSFELAILANRADHAEIISRAENAKGDLNQEDRLIAGWREVGLDFQGEAKSIGDYGEVVVRRNNRSGRNEYLVVFEAQRVTGDYVARASKTTDEQIGTPALEFEFTKEGGLLLEKLTTKNRPRKDGFGRRLAILFDDQIHSAPTIMSAISNKGVITGKFTNKEVEDLATMLSSGPLPLTLKLVPQSPDASELGDNK